MVFFAPSLLGALLFLSLLSVLSVQKVFLLYWEVFVQFLIVGGILIFQWLKPVSLLPKEVRLSGQLTILPDEIQVDGDQVKFPANWIVKAKGRK